MSDVTISTIEISGTTGSVAYRAVVEGGEEHEVRVTARDADGREVARATGSDATLRIEEVELWRPGAGYLYTLDVEILAPGGELVDVYPQPFGVRTVAVDGHRFLINGEPFYFTGFGKHEDFAVRGAVTTSRSWCTTSSCSHGSARTPSAPRTTPTTRPCSTTRTGTASSSSTRRRPWGSTSTPAPRSSATDELPTYSEATISARTQETHRQAIRELVARDKNHPCVVIWSIANEPDTVAPEARAYFEPLVAEARRLDPTRPVGFANFMLATPERDVVSDLFDVLLLNRYFGWYVHTGELESAERGARGRAARVGRARQADHHDRVRRRHAARGCTA